MRTPQRGTNMYCPDCKKIRVCEAVPLTSIGYKSGQRRYHTEHPDIHWFQRGRRCRECRREFVTAELEQKFLDELVDLRSALSEIRQDAEKCEEELDQVSKASRTVSKSVKGLKSLVAKIREGAG